MSNVTKYKRRAAEFEQLRQFDKAVSSYAMAIEEAEADGEEVEVGLYNKVGDLMLRMGRVPDAVRYYERAVEKYSSTGLHTNAIALCNKILRHAPGRSAVYLTLGRICARKGLRGDASRNFLEYATRMRSENRTDEAMRALAEIVELMPELSEIRGMVEEYASRAGIALRTAEDGSAAKSHGSHAPDLIFLEVEPSVTSAPQSIPVTNWGTLRATPEASAPAAQSTSAGAASTAGLAGAHGGTATARQGASGGSHGASGVSGSGAGNNAAGNADPFVHGGSRSVVSDPFESALIFDPLDFDGDNSPESALETVESVDLESCFDDAEPKVESVAVDSLLEPEMPEPVLAGSALAETALAAPSLAETALAEPEIDPQLEETTATELQLTPDDYSDPGVPPLEGLTELESVSDVNEVSDDSLEDFTGRRLEVQVVSPAGLCGNDDFIAADEQYEDAFVDTGLIGLELSEEVNAELEVETSFAASASRPDLADAAEPQVDYSASDTAQTVEDSEPEVQASGYAMRMDPHTLVLPGELPPLLISDVVPSFDDAVDGVSIDDLADATIDIEADIEDDVVAGALPHDLADAAIDVDDDAESDAVIDITNDVASDAAIEAAPAVTDIAEIDINADADAARDSAQGDSAHGDEIDTLVIPERAASPAELPVADDTPTPESDPAVRQLHLLEMALADAPNDLTLRHRYAEALVELGKREEGIAELERVLNRYVDIGDRGSAYGIASQLVLVGGHRVRHHQKRVELAVRLNEPSRLRESYLDLADTLVRMGEDARAHAVYARVLEIDPRDERARLALGDAAPPLPEEPEEQPYVDLASWLSDEDGSSTRMRMRAPEITGDEQADFDSLLKHFKEGVARSIGDDDHDSHYDLGVAYKEMGLLDDAIAEFQKALRSRVHRLAAWEALGQCFLEQGNHQVAITVLSRALHEPGLGDQHRIGVLYLLGYALSFLQRTDEARGYFQRVYDIDRHFRDVAARLAAIDQVTR